MSSRAYLSAPEQNEFKRRLRIYAETYPDSDFLDNAHGRAESGFVFTREIAGKVDDALANWERRLRGPSWDPDRCPKGSDPHIWLLASRYRDAMEERGCACPSRRLIYAEIARIIRRDHLHENYSPWRDEPDAPGWYRMLSDVISTFVSELPGSPSVSHWYAHEELGQPGEVLRIIGWLKDQARLRQFEARARPAIIGSPAAGRRAAVRAWIAGRKQRDR